MAPLSYKEQFGYYNLRVNPTFATMLGTVRKPLNIPLPDRNAKWYANSVYRSLVVNAEEKLNQAEQSALEYRKSDTQLPADAAGINRSPAAHDPAWDRIHQHDEAMKEHSSYEDAFDVMNAEQRHESHQLRSERLRMMHEHGAGHPVVDASQDELAQAGVPFDAAWSRHPLHGTNVWHSPPPQMASYGHSQAPEFPSFESMNMGQNHRHRPWRELSVSEAQTYERQREVVVEPTWST